MKKLLAILIIAAAIISGCAMTTTVPEKTAKGIEVGDAVVITAEVVAIQKADRTMALRAILLN